MRGGGERVGGGWIRLSTLSQQPRLINGKIAFLPLKFAEIAEKPNFFS
jgi:hypothetical protein